MHPCLLHPSDISCTQSVISRTIETSFFSKSIHQQYFTHLYLFHTSLFKAIKKHQRAMRLPNDILYIISQFISLPDYLSLTSSIFTPLLSISRKKRIEWCRSKIRLYPFQNSWCSVCDCYNRRLVCFELEPHIHTNVLSNYCGQHTVEYFHLSDFTILLTKYKK